MTDRTPPHDPHAEQTMIGLALNRGRIPETADHLTSTDFYRPDHETIWSTIIALSKAKNPCDITTVRARLQEQQQLQNIGGAPYLIELLNIPPAADPTHVAHIITQRSLRRKIIEVHTRGLQDAYESSDESEALLQRSELGLQKVPAQDTGNVDTLRTLEEFLQHRTPEPQWVLPGYLARCERLVITGGEGLGKTTWLRQMAICGAAGMDPFTGHTLDPITVLAIDVENPEHLIQDSYDELLKAVRSHGKTVTPNRFWLDNRPEGIDLGHPPDRRWLQRRVKVVNPDLLVIGPAYKLHTAGNNDKDETIARTIMEVLDELRTTNQCALILEHHAGNEQGGGERPVRPFGSSLWRRWPEFGYGIRLAKHPEADERRIVDVVPWRGPRTLRAWPKQMESGGDGMPWIQHTHLNERKTA